jgi:MFS family permease
MGMTQGVLAAMIASAAPAALRGTAFGVFYLGSGIAMLVGSVLAGFIWDEYGSHATFYAGAGFAVAALPLFLMVRAGAAARAA